jgi:hypothetical protein
MELKYSLVADELSNDLLDVVNGGDSARGRGTGEEPLHSSRGSSSPFERIQGYHDTGPDLDGREEKGDGSRGLGLSSALLFFTSPLIFEIQIPVSTQAAYFPVRIVFPIILVTEDQHCATCSHDR